MSIAIFLASCSCSFSASYPRAASLRRCKPALAVSDPATEGAWTQLSKRPFEETGEDAGKDLEKCVSAHVRSLLEKGFKVPPKETSVAEPMLTFLAITIFETSERLKRMNSVLDETATTSVLDETATTIKIDADKFKAKQVRTASLAARLVTCVTAPLSVAARAFWVRTIDGGMVPIPVLILGNLVFYLAIYSVIYLGCSSLTWASTW